LLVPLPDSSERTRLLLEVYPELINTLDRLGAEPAEAEAVYVEAIDVARHAADRRAEALIEAAYGWLKTGHNEWTAVIEHATRAMALADAEGDLPIQLFARWSLGRALAWRGLVHESERIYDQAAEIGGGDGGADIEVLGWRIYVECLSIRSAVKSMLGRPREGLEFAEWLPALLRRSRLQVDMAQPATDRIWTCWILGDAGRARRYTDEALRIGERFGTDRNVVYALAACGIASCLGLRWDEGDRLLERARQRIAASGAGGEWSMLVDGFQALCLAGMGDRDRSLALARRGVEQATANALDWPRVMQGALAARVLRMAGDQYRDELEARIVETLELIQQADMVGMLPLVLLERAGLSRMRGDADGMARDLAEARRSFAEMGVTGWDDYARSVEA
jgi:tetratricopeptide (TPR) repeat protein